jgi:hypothetical protein
MQKLTGFLRHLFIPNEENNFRAKLLHHDFLTYYLLFAIFFTFILKISWLSNILGFATDITVEKLYQLTNQERQKNGLAPLNYSEELSQAAYKKAQDMFTKNYWSHYAPDGTTPWNFILASGYRYEFAGENLAKNFLFSDGVVSAWMNSPTHRDNILRKEYTDVGFAVVNGILNGEETTLVVQMFGKPLEKTITLNQPKVSQAKEKTSVLLPSPSASKKQIYPQPVVLAKEEKQNKLNLTKFSLDINFIFLTFLLLALGMDLYFAKRLGVVRFTGKNIAHFIFVIFLLISLFYLPRGKVL